MRIALLSAVAIAAIAFTTPVSAATSKPSFNCAKAKLAVENQICSNAEMATSDAAIARSYAKLKTTLDPVTLKALAKDQRWFIAVRNDALGSNSLLDTRAEKIERLRVMLSERADFLASIQPRANDDLTGEWSNFAGAFEISKDAQGVLRVSANAVDPVAARWVCEFDGKGEAARAGQAVIAKSTEAEPNEQGLSLSSNDRLLTVEELHNPNEWASVYCGLNGGLAGSYFPVRH